MLGSFDVQRQLFMDLDGLEPAMRDCVRRRCETCTPFTSSEWARLTQGLQEFFFGRSIGKAEREIIGSYFERDDVPHAPQVQG